MKRVGILGGTGEIGKRILNILKHEYPVIASYRNRIQESKENCAYVKLDTSDLNALREFCKQCDILVNCAGASYINGENVARIASEFHIPYIDPSGESFLEDKISDIKDNNIFVLSSGYFPGMTGLLMRYLCESFDSPKEILGLSISEEVPSQSAIEDFILTNLAGFGVALNYYDDGQIKRDENEIFEIIKNKEYKFQNYLTVEIERLVKNFSLKKANWYNSSFGEEITQKMQEAVIKLKSIDGRNEYGDTVKEIREIFKKNSKIDRLFCYIRIDAKGIIKNKEIHKRAELSSDCSSEISAIIAAYTVKTILKTDLKNGIYYGMDVINAEELFKELPGLNAEFIIYENEERGGFDGDYEEGEL